MNRKIIVWGTWIVSAVALMCILGAGCRGIKSTFTKRREARERARPLEQVEPTKAEPQKKKIVEVVDSRRTVEFNGRDWSELVKPPAGRFYISAVGTNAYHVRAFVNGVEAKVVRINPLDPIPIDKRTKEWFSGGVITFQFMSESSPTNAVVVEGVHNEVVYN